MSKKSIILPSLIIILGITCFSLCNKKDYYDAANIEELVSNSPNVYYDVISRLVIEFDDVNKLKDTINCPGLFEQCGEDKVKVRFNTLNGTPVDVKRTIYYYPTIWSLEYEYDLIQYIYLYNLGFRKTKELDVSNGVFNYNQVNEADNFDDGECFFANISPSKLRASIKSIPHEYALKGRDSSSYKFNSWEKEEPIWQKLVRKYRTGMFITDDSKTFFIEPDEVFLDITFKCNDGTQVKKVFKDRIIVGN